MKIRRLAIALLLALAAIALCAADGWAQGIEDEIRAEGAWYGDAVNAGDPGARPCEQARTRSAACSAVRNTHRR